MDFKLPELGENVESGDVVAVLVSEGDAVQAGDAVLELETDKATVEVPVESAGVVSKIHVAKNDTIEVGQLILTLEAREPSEAARSEPAESTKGAGEDEEDLPDSAKVEEPGAGKEVSGKEATRERSPSQQDSGRVVDFRRPSTGPGRRAGPVIPAAPSVRKFAREIGIDVGQVEGSGPKGRISINDIKRFAKALNRGRSGQVRSMATVSLPDFAKFGTIERESFSNVRRKTAEHLAAAWAAIPHVTQHDKADITELETLRRRYADRVGEAGGKLTVTAIALKVVAVALKRFPKFNASIDVESEEVIYKKYCNIGVAVDTPRGLLVPVIRDVDQKNIVELSVELNTVAERARNAKIGLDDLQGGCFTVTNLGGIGGDYFTPIVNAPEVAILGISRAVTEPIWQDGEFQPRKRMPLSLSYDHRLIDGADAVRFLRWVVQALENPFLLSLQG